MPDDDWLAKYGPLFENDAELYQKFANMIARPNDRCKDSFGLEVDADSTMKVDDCKLELCPDYGWVTIVGPESPPSQSLLTPDNETLKEGGALNCNWFKKSKYWSPGQIANFNAPGNPLSPPNPTKEEGTDDKFFCKYAIAQGLDEGSSFKTVKVPVTVGNLPCPPFMSTRCIQLAGRGEGNNSKCSAPKYRTSEQIKKNPRSMGWPDSPKTGGVPCSQNGGNFTCKDEKCEEIH